MRSHKDRRKKDDALQSSTEDNGRAALLRDRRKHHERRMENMKAEDRQLMYSEMPSPISKKPD
jgi:hypothetical protein